MSTQQIIDEVKTYIADCGGSYNVWYVGITSDINQRLFVDHGVNKEGDKGIYRTADSAENARSAEDLLHNLGCDGDSGGGDYTSRIVYCYKKNSHTNP